MSDQQQKIENTMLRYAAFTPAINKAMLYSIECHSNVNHTYDKKHPYAYHLRMVYEVGFKYRHLLLDHQIITALAACWAHDVIEDTRQTYNDVKAELGEDVAEIVYTVSNEKGKTRKERANSKYYAGIRANELAVFVKLCDRIANVTYSKENKSSMFEKYKSENDHFLNQLLGDDFVPMVSKSIVQKDAKIFTPMAEELVYLFLS